MSRYFNNLPRLQVLGASDGMKLHYRLSHQNPPGYPNFQLFWQGIIRALLYIARIILLFCQGIVESCFCSLPIRRHFSQLFLPVCAKFFVSFVAVEFCVKIENILFNLHNRKSSMLANFHDCSASNLAWNFFNLTHHCFVVHSFNF